MEIKLTVTIDDEELKKLLNVQYEPACKNHEQASIYARWFNETSTGWTKDPESNRLFLLMQQSYATEKLKAQGYLFLNDVYDMLGMRRTKYGQVVGWIYDENNTIGDNCVDFDLFSSRNENFINGNETSVLLDFNVDGNILDRLED